MRYLFILLCISAFCMSNYNPKVGDVIDSLNNIPVYYNGKMNNVQGRHYAPGGYNLGLKYQCVEFVKRYYYYHIGHRMPNSYGHAKDFFDKSLPDRGYNSVRALLQFRNTREYKPIVNDIIIYDGTHNNPFGHMAVVSEVGDDYVEIIQQNWGTKSRQRLKLVEFEGIYTVADFSVLGWLRKPY